MILTMNANNKITIAFMSNTGAPQGINFGRLNSARPERVEKSTRPKKILNTYPTTAPITTGIAFNVPFAFNAIKIVVTKVINATNAEVAIEAPAGSLKKLNA